MNSEQDKLIGELFHKLYTFLLNYAKSSLKNTHSSND